MKKVRYEDMLPYEIVPARLEKAVAYLPLGGLEWHGEHMAVGNDALKAHRLCELAAARGGGLAMPVLWYGEPRVSHLMESNAEDRADIIGAMKLDPAHFVTAKEENPFGTSAEEQEEFYRKLIRHTLVQIHTLGFKAIVILTGHYPLYDWVQPVVETFNAERNDCQAFVGIEFHYDVAALGEDKIGGDHAAKWETSYLMALRPECVDMSVFQGRPADERLIGVGGEDPRVHASKRLGQAACDLIVRGMIEKGEELLEKAKA
ncbi:MAG: creatininase family protein [Phycisphaerae bacterium]|nr:creatininase family protein [Phycisphaerae bacterium]